MSRIVLASALASLLLGQSASAIDPPQVQIEATMDPPDWVNVQLSWEPVPEACKYRVYMQSPSSGVDSLLLSTSDTQAGFSLPTDWSWAASPDLVRLLRVTSEDSPFGLPCDGLVAYYPLDGAGGSDEVRNLAQDAHHGLRHGAIYVEDRRGIPATAMQFDGVNDYVGFIDPIQLNCISVSLWFRSAGLSQDLTMFRYRPFGYNLGIEHSEDGNRLLVGCYVSNGTDLYRYDSNLNYGLDNQWHHLVLSYSGSSFEVYFDGELELSSSIFGESNPLFYYTGGMAIGRDGANSDRYFSGAIDDIVVYDRGLSESEVQVLFEN